MTSTRLQFWRAQHRLSLREVADLLGVNSPSTIKIWEDGGEIPGPASKLLDWLIDGIVPFDREQASPAMQAAMWRVEMSLEAWERLDALRVAGGYATVTDWIAALIAEELQEQSREAPEPAPGKVVEMPQQIAAETPASPPVTEERREVTYRDKRGRTKPE